MSKRFLRRATLLLPALSLSLLLSGAPEQMSVSAGEAAPAPRPPQIVVQNPQNLTAAVAPAPAIPRAVVQTPGAPPAAPAAPTAGGAAGNVPRVIVIDRAYILQRSSAGKDMLNQMQALSKQAEAQFRSEETALQNEAQQLQQQLAIMAADVRDQKEKDFMAKQQAFQQRIQQRQAEIQAGFNQATRQLEVALEPILQNLMKEKGANMVLDRASVLLASIDIDVTQLAVQRLDKDFPHVKVELVKLPPGSVPSPAGPAGRSPAVAAAPARK